MTHHLEARQRDLHSHVLSSQGRLFEAERRVLRLLNPGLPGKSATTSTLFAGVQIVMPGEVARAHHHTMAALRLVIEAEGGYTVVNGDIAQMAPGDLILTPNWAWHDHANDSDAPLIWLVWQRMASTLRSMYELMSTW